MYFVLLFVLSLILLFSYIEIAKHFDIVDKPDNRRVNKVPIARGGGIVVMSLIIFASLFRIYFSSSVNSELIFILFATLVVTAVFFVEDIRNLRPVVRLLFQVSIVSFSCYYLRNDIILFPILPQWANLLIIGIGWLWFVNLYNFMDGVDGMTAVNTTFFTLAIMFFAGLNANLAHLDLLLSSILPVMIGFLILNFQPAKVFIGDSGSISLGYLFGYIMLKTAMNLGVLIPTLICSYYLIDTSFTIIKRIKDKKNITEPHLEHYFHIAFLSGMQPRQICLVIALLNIVLLFVAYMFFLHNTTIWFIVAGFTGFVLNLSVINFFKKA